MPHAPRCDDAGSWHHVVNRGIARRSVFESRADVRFFLSRLARVVRRGWLEIHAFAILTTHFHLLVRSDEGRLSAALGWAQNQYVRWFNRRRRRDGPLFRGRFASRPVRDASHWRTALAYIDENAVHARLASEPCAFPWSSAACFARPRGPPWLRRDVVEGAVVAASAAEAYHPDLYRGFATVRIADAATRSVVSLGCGTGAPAFDLLAAAPAEVLEWMRRKARLADATSPGRDLVPAAATVELLRRRLASLHSASAVDAGALERTRACLTAGLLRLGSGSSLDEIAARLDCSRAKAHRLVEEHGRRLAFDAPYGEIASSLLVALTTGRRGVRKK